MFINPKPRTWLWFLGSGSNIPCIYLHVGEFFAFESFLLAETQILSSSSENEEEWQGWGYSVGFWFTVKFTANEAFYLPRVLCFIIQQMP